MLFLPQETLDGLPERGKLVLDNVPEDLYVDPEVLVNQDVAQSADLLPLDVGATRAELLRQALDCLTDHFEIAHDGVDGLVVRGERLSG